MTQQSSLSTLQWGAFPPSQQGLGEPLLSLWEMGLTPIIIPIGWDGGLTPQFGTQGGGGWITWR